MSHRLKDYFSKNPPAGAAVSESTEPSEWVRVKLIHPQGLMMGDGPLMCAERGSVVVIRRSTVESSPPGIFQLLPERFPE
jgi:hypothetical protein